MTPPGAWVWFYAALFDRIFYRLGRPTKRPRPWSAERRGRGRLDVPGHPGNTPAPALQVVPLMAASWPCSGRPRSPGTQSASGREPVPPGLPRGLLRGRLSFREKGGDTVRILLVGWLLLLVTLAAVALVNANWYEYRRVTDVRGGAVIMTAEAEGWESVPGEQPALAYRRPRLRLW